MPMPSILGQGVFILCMLAAGIARPRLRRRAAALRSSSERDAAAPETQTATPLERMPDSSSLAGVPLRILRSDRSGPGALLRDTLMNRPSTRDS